MGLNTGTVLSGRYRLEAPLGTGATAAVWRARDVDLGRLVAVKLLHTTGVDPELAARFTREGRILGRLNHPNIVPVVAAGDDDGQPYLVMALVEGPSLKERLAVTGPYPVAEAVGLVADIAAGLATAHRVGVVHRDVKPGNIVCGDDGVPRLVDFGIARAGDLTTMTSADVVMGTAAYLSPEQARGEVPGPASDVYALGCVLFELLTGRQPFEAESAVAVAYQHVHDAPVAPSELRPEVPVALDGIVLRCLAKPPADRYGDAGALEQALRRWQSGIDDATVALPALTPIDATAVLPVIGDTAEPDGHRPSRRPLVVAACLAAAVLAVALITATTGHDGSANTTTPPSTTATTATTVVTTVPTTAAPPPTTAPAPRGKHGKHGEGGG